jgi:hypothetical protein
MREDRSRARSYRPRSTFTASLRNFVHALLGIGSAVSVMSRTRVPEYRRIID